MGCRAGSRWSLYYKDVHFFQNLAPSVNKTFCQEIYTKRYTETERAKELGKKQTEGEAEKEGERKKILQIEFLPCSLSSTSLGYHLGRTISWGRAHFVRGVFQITCNEKGFLCTLPTLSRP